MHKHTNVLYVCLEQGGLHISTVGPRLSGHQLSGYLHYPAMMLQYIVYCLYCLSLAQYKNKGVKYLFYFMVLIHATSVIIWYK